MNKSENKRLNRTATRVVIIVAITLVLAFVLLTSSCTSRSERLQNTKELLDKVNSNVQTSTVINDPEIEGTVKVIHPDMLHSHIVMDKTRTSYINGNAYQRILTWNYADSIYQLYYIPIAASRGLTYHDTIHVVYQQWVNEVNGNK